MNGDALWFSPAVYHPTGNTLLTVGHVAPQAGGSVTLAGNGRFGQGLTYNLGPSSGDVATIAPGSLAYDAFVLRINSAGGLACE
jgi:hypothetical protein